MTRERAAPRAMRIPISGVRRTTVYEVTPYIQCREQQRQQSEERREARDQTLFNEAIVDLLLKGLELDDRQIWIDAANVSPASFSKPESGLLVWTTIAPAYIDMSFSTGSSGSVTAGRCVKGTKYMAWSFQ